MNDSGQGSQCNHAIIIISDGAEKTYEELFQRNNWPEKKVRLLTSCWTENWQPSQKYRSCCSRSYFIDVVSFNLQRIEQIYVSVCRPLRHWLVVLKKITGTVDIVTSNDWHDLLIRCQLSDTTPVYQIQLTIIEYNYRSSDISI